MDFVPSTSSHIDPDHSPPNTRLKMTQSVADRMVRALCHRLLLLHRSDMEFFILGATGNVYTVTLSLTPSCTCPDRITPCKHILFVLIRVLGVPVDDSCLRRRTLRPCQHSHLISSPTLPESLASASIREIFHRLFVQSQHSSNIGTAVEIKDGTNCPICLDEMQETQKVVACQTCRNPIHEECLLAWKKSSRRRSATCVICRARWKIQSDRNTYLNLSAHVIQDDMPEAGALCCD